MMQRIVRDGARTLLLPVLVGLSGFLLGAAGCGFLISWAFMTLSVAWGPEGAALAMGLGLMLLAVVPAVWIKRRWWNPTSLAATVAEAPATQPHPTKPATPDEVGRDAASLVAFTGAFVLGRYLTGNGRE